MIDKDKFVSSVKKYLKKLSELYVSACGDLDAITDRGALIIRGRARCISSYAEDKMAELIRDVLSPHVENLVVFVDMPLCFYGTKKRKDGEPKVETCYPDVVIGKMISEGRYEILHLLELKVNAGWCRDKMTGERTVGGKVTSTETLDSELTQEIVALTTNKKVWANAYLHNGRRKERIEIIVSEKLRYDLVVCSSRNISASQLKSAEARINTAENDSVRMFVLTDKEIAPKYANDSKRNKNALLDDVRGDVESWCLRLNNVFCRHACKKMAR